MHDHGHTPAPTPEPAPPVPVAIEGEVAGLAWAGRRLAMPGTAGDRARAARAKLVQLLAERLVADAERHAQRDDDAPSDPG